MCVMLNFSIGAHDVSTAPETAVQALFAAGSKGQLARRIMTHTSAHYNFGNTPVTYEPGSFTIVYYHLFYVMHCCQIPHTESQITTMGFKSLAVANTQMHARTHTHTNNVGIQF